jgi:hypothetical protein
LLTAIETAIIGMCPGEYRKITVPPEEAYGDKKIHVAQSLIFCVLVYSFVFPCLAIVIVCPLRPVLMIPLVSSNVLLTYFELTMLMVIGTDCIGSRLLYVLSNTKL